MKDDKEHIISGRAKFDFENKVHPVSCLSYVILKKLCSFCFRLVIKLDLISSKLYEKQNILIEFMFALDMEYLIYWSLTT